MRNILEKYGRKLFIFLGCDVVYFVLWVIPAITISNIAAIFTGIGLLVMTALSFVEVEDDTFRNIKGDERWFRVAFIVGGVCVLVGIVLALIFI